MRTKTTNNNTYVYDLELVFHFSQEKKAVTWEPTYQILTVCVHLTIKDIYQVAAGCQKNFMVFNLSSQFKYSGLLLHRELT
jgi:hypothetical protein